MPPLRQAWRQGLSAIHDESITRCSSPFPVLHAVQQDEVLQAIQSGKVRSIAWKHLPPRRFFVHILLKTVVGIYYSHPRAWSEVGFGGPASPRGYVRLGADQRDPWEPAEHHG
jgi:Gluconate 2-dehydrogenase subunit 3